MNKICFDKLGQHATFQNTRTLGQPLLEGDRKLRFEQNLPDKTLWFQSEHLTT